MITRHTIGWLSLPIALLLWHLMNQYDATFGLMFDEAQYWLWGKQPDWGYYSKPPMIGWLMGLGTALLGDDVLGVKWLSPLLHAVIAALVWQIARALKHSAATAWWCVVMYLSLPIVSFASAFFSTDTPLLVFWSLGLLAWLRVLESPQSWRNWLLLGVAAGGGMLSKYTMVLFGLCALCSLYRHPNWRAAVWNPRLVVVKLIALALFAPNLWWNMRHHFATVAHTQDNVFSKSISLYPSDMLAFIAAQAATLGPILLVMLLWMVVRVRHATPQEKFLHAFIWPVALSGIAVSLVAGAQAHWIAPAYVGIVLLVVPWMVLHTPRLLRVALVLQVLVALLLYAVPMRLSILPPVANALDRVFVFNRLQSSASNAIARYPHAVLATDERKIAAALTYQLRRPDGMPYLVRKLNFQPGVHDHYDLLTKPEDLKGRDVLLVTRYASLEGLRASVPNAQALWEIYLGEHRFMIFLLPNYRGVP